MVAKKYKYFVVHNKKNSTATHYFSSKDRARSFARKIGSIVRKR